MQRRSQGEVLRVLGPPLGPFMGPVLRGPGIVKTESALRQAINVPEQLAALKQGLLRTSETLFQACSGPSRAEMVPGTFKHKSTKALSQSEGPHPSIIHAIEGQGLNIPTN